MKTSLLYRHWRRLLDSRSGMAAVEFALTLPFVVGTTMAGVELTNFTVSKMRVSQLALHVADNASRIGTGSLLSAKRISEAQINDLLTGAGLQGGNLNLYTNGRVILSSLEPDPATAGKYRIRWQRCRGAKSYVSATPQGTNTLSSLSVNGEPITAPTGGAVMVVQIAYDYAPLIGRGWINLPAINEWAAMTVRDPRDMAGPAGGVGVYNSENVTPSSCT